MEISFSCTHPLRLYEFLSVHIKFGEAFAFAFAFFLSDILWWTVMMRPVFVDPFGYSIGGRKRQTEDSGGEKTLWCAVMWIIFSCSKREIVHDSRWHRLSVWWMDVMVFRIIVVSLFFHVPPFSYSPSRALFYTVSLSWMIHQIWRK